MSVPDLLPVLFFAAIFPPALVRTVARNTIRKAVGLERDVAPWSFKAGFVRFTPDLARNTLPAWQIDETGLYLPGIGDRLGVWAGALVVWIAYGGFWHGLDALVPLLPYLFFVAVIWLVFTLAEAMRWMRLPEPGKTWWSSW